MSAESLKDHKTIKSCISHLEKLGTELTLPANKTIISVGEVADSIYIIKEGSVCTIRYTPSGNKRIFWESRQTADDDPIFLTAGTLTGREISVDIVTETPVRLLQISRAALIDAMLKDPVIGAGLSFILASRFMDVKGQFHEAEESSFEKRFYELLLKYAADYGIPYDNKTLINTKLSQQTMADMLHVDRTTVARGIKKLKEENLIERINDLYCIKDIGALKKKLKKASE